MNINDRQKFNEQLSRISSCRVRMPVFFAIDEPDAFI